MMILVGSYPWAMNNLTISQRPQSDNREQKPGAPTYHAKSQLPKVYRMISKLLWGESSALKALIPMQHRQYV